MKPLTQAISSRDPCPSQSVLLLVVTLLFALDPRHQSVDAAADPPGCTIDSAAKSAVCNGCMDKNSVRVAVTKLTILPSSCTEFLLLGFMPMTPFNSFRLLETLVITNNANAPHLKMSFNFTRLKNLHLSNNRLMGVGTQFPNTLKTLDLSNNRITVLTVTTFTGLHQLETLDLSGNPFQTIENGVFQNLTEIQEIWLNGANVSFPPEKLFNSLFELKRLYMSGCNVNFFPDGMLKNTRLELLDVSKNNFLRIPAWTLRETLSVPKVVNLSANEIWEMWDVKGMTMDVLNLSGNPLSEVHAGAFSDSKINHLVLTGTSLKTLPDSMYVPLKAAHTILDLSGMVMVCNCSILWLSRFLQENRSTVSPKCDQQSSVYSGFEVREISSLLENRCPISRRTTEERSHLGTANIVNVVVVGIILVYVAAALPVMCWVACCNRKATTGDDWEEM